MKTAEEIFESLPYCHSGHRYVSGSTIDEIVRNARRQGMLDALKYVLAISGSKRALRRRQDYLVALDEIDLHCNASIERLEAGEPMELLAVTTDADATPKSRR